MEEDDDTMVAAKGTTSASSVQKVKTSHPAEDGPAHQAVSIDQSQSDSLDVETESQDTTEAGQPQSGCSQRHRLRKEKGLDKPNEKERQMEPTKEERNSTDNSKIAPGKNSDNDAASPTIGASGTDSSSQKALASTDNLEATAQSITGSHSAEIKITKLVQQNTTPKGESHVIDGHGQESVASSRTMTPQTARSFEEIATHKKSSVENSTPNKKHTGLAECIEASGVDAVNNDKLTSGYSMTTSQLSSAVEDLSYSTETVIRHKPGRPSLPLQWADADAGEGGRTGTQSPPAGVLTGSTRLRLGDVDRRFNVLHIRSIAHIPPEDMAQAIMTGDLGDVIGNALTKEATPSGATSVSNEDKTTDKSLGNLDTKSAVATEQKSGPRRRKNKSKKKQSQGARSHLTSRSETPIDTQSHGPSPALEHLVSAAAFDEILRKDSSTNLQNNEASPECSSQPKKTKRTQLVTEVSDEQATRGGSGDNKKPEDAAASSLEKTEARQGDLAEGSVTQAPSIKNPDKASNGKIRSDTTGDSLRMPKNRSPKKGSQKSAPQNAAKSEGSTMGQVPSLSSIFEPPAKDMTDAAVETNAFADQKSIVDDTSARKPESATNSLKLSKNTDNRVALPRVALPLQQVARTTKTGGSWASVAKGAVSHASKTDKIDNNDQFTVDKEQVVLGDFIKAKNLKSAQKARENKEKKDVSHDKSSPTPSPEKNPHRQIATAKSQLNAAVKSFNPSVSCTTQFPSTKLNPNATTFSLASSASQSVASAYAPGYDQSVAIEKPIVAGQQMPIPDRTSGNKRHAKKASLTGPTGKMDKRFITPAEQVLDATKVVQPPPPSKESKRVGESKKSTENILITEQVKDVKKALETGTQVAEHANAKTTHETHPALGPKALNTESFPTLHQAATVGPNKKRRHASSIKSGPSAPNITARASGTIMGNVNKASSQVIGPNDTQQNGGKPKQITAQGSGITQEGGKEVWQTVAPKQKNNGGASKGHHRGGRTGKYGGGRGGRGERNGAMEERKGG